MCIYTRVLIQQLQAEGWEETEQSKDVTTQTAQHHRDTGERKVVTWGNLKCDLPRLSRGWLIRDDLILRQEISLTGKLR